MKPSSAYYRYTQLPPALQAPAAPGSGGPPAAATPFGPQPVNDPNPEALLAIQLQFAKYHPALQFIKPEPPWPRPQNEPDWTLNNLAVDCLETDPFGASRIFREALEHESQSAVIWNNLGLTSLAAGDLDRAAEYFQQSRTCDQNFAPAWNHLALTYLEAGQFRRSWRCFSKALGCAARDPLVHNNSGVLFLALSQPEPARRHCKTAVAADPNCYPAYYNLGAAADQLGDRTAAIDYWEQGSKVADQVWPLDREPAAA